MQVTLGLPEPRAFSSLPRLKLVQAGIRRVHSQETPISSKIRLPITPAILKELHGYWSKNAGDQDVFMIWAAAIMCFFGFFRAGEITTPTLTFYDPRKHLAWADVTMDDPINPSTLRIRLKFSKTDQFGKGADVYLGKTGCRLCPIAGILAYMVSRGSDHGPFLALSRNSQSWFAKPCKP